MLTPKRQIGEIESNQDTLRKEMNEAWNDGDDWPDDPAL